MTKVFVVAKRINDWMEKSERKLRLFGSMVMGIVFMTFSMKEIMEISPLVGNLIIFLFGLVIFCLASKAFLDLTGKDTTQKK